MTDLSTSNRSTAAADGGRRPVTVIGLGSMGAALARAFLRAGHVTTVWNRTAEKTTPLADEGASQATTVAAAVAASPLIVTCLTGFDETRAALEPAASQLVGRDLVTLNTGSPAGARDMAALATEWGARFLAGAIKDVPGAIGQPETLLTYSGDPAVFADHAATLRVLGGETVYLGEEPDLAAFYEMAVGGLLLPTLMGFFQGAAALQSRGLAAASMVGYTEKWLDMIKNLLPGLADQIDRRDYSDASSSIDLFLSVAAAEQEFASETGVDVAWQDAAWDRVRRASELGYGDQEISAVTEVLRPHRPGDDGDDPGRRDTGNSRDGTPSTVETSKA
ncbi:NAD(P)-dependent oxidoreductase [Phytoactinopolyspora halotolerans]|uniref:NAD(P)-dependent oxidoreductase n=1 Tax=Phytoactinopolyspora halotolerans TaxID=1981512 RepID=A0A6L9S254_9ACTN|nr:NAD(P)-binding domain-containing protein [Phytoactinopolyspora halotolerans]NED99086.1 NAD(P)-dependent oxidoreductase [Phytoactinopolyspora halotolerans]